jgi:hypothetical protein
MNCCRCGRPLGSQQVPPMSKCLQKFADEKIRLNNHGHLPSSVLSHAFSTLILKKNCTLLVKLYFPCAVYSIG